MTKTLKKRIEQLERTSDGDLDARLRALAERVGIDPERLLALVGQHRERLSREIGTDGMVTWETACWLHDCGIL